VNTYFEILLGVSRQQLQFDEDPRVEVNPDRIAGTLGSLRDEYGIWFEKRDKTLLPAIAGGLRSNPYSNSVEDEQDITNFRVVSDYMTSLLQSWRANGKFFKLTLGMAPAFLGTQLILISRQCNVIVETVNEVRFTLDSVFIGPNERQQLLLELHHPLPSMYLEDALREIEEFVSDEGPRLIRDGGRIAVYNNLLPVVGTLIEMIREARQPLNLGLLPDGYKTPRVRNSMDDLRVQLEQLMILAQQVGMPIPSARTLALGE
jgi:hypothetical protein